MKKAIFLCLSFIQTQNLLSMEQPDLAELLKRNNELLIASMQQNHFIAARDINILKQHDNSQNFQTRMLYLERAERYNLKLQDLYKKHNINIEGSSSAHSSTESHSSSKSSSED